VNNDGVMPVDLSEAERSLWAAYPDGRWVDFRTGNARQDHLKGAGQWGRHRTVRAEVVAALLLGAAPAEPGRVAAVRLRGARIIGRLDVMGGTVTCALVCECCYFDTAPRFTDASTKTVRLTDSHLAGFSGVRMRSEGILSLARTSMDTELRLEHAVIRD
jgi:hypothetical protein